MIAFVRLQLLLWSRRPGGQATVAGAALLPWFIYGPLALAIDVNGEDRSAAIRGIAFACHCFFAGPSLANLLARSIHDSRRRGEARLLRTTGLDGHALVGAYLALGLLVAPVCSGAAQLLPVLLGVAPAAFPGFVAGVLLLACVAPIAIPVAFVLPRTAAVVVLSAGVPLTMLSLWSFLGDADGAGARLDAAPTAGLAFVPLALNLSCLLVVSPLWSRWASRLGF